MAGSSKSKADTVDAYLAVLPEEQREALETLRQIIRSEAPDAEECISYGIPTFRMQGRMLVSFGAAAKHCSFYPGALPMTTYEHELAGYSTSRGTVRFQPDKPLPPALVRNMVSTRLAERMR